MYIIISEEKMHHVTVPMILHRISDVQKTTEQPYIATEMDSREKCRYATARGRV